MLDPTDRNLYEKVLSSQVPILLRSDTGRSSRRTRCLKTTADRDRDRDREREEGGGGGDGYYIKSCDADQYRLGERPVRNQLKERS